MPYSESVKEEARRIDPECWHSYSGTERHNKRVMDARRSASLRSAEEIVARREAQEETDEIEAMISPSLEDVQRRSDETDCGKMLARRALIRERLGWALDAMFEDAMSKEERIFRAALQALLRGDI